MSEGPAAHTLAVALARALRARAGSARLRLPPMGAKRTRPAAPVSSSSALVDCAHSIRRALLLPHTKRGVEAGAMRRPEGVYACTGYAGRRL